MSARPLVSRAHLPVSASSSAMERPAKSSARGGLIASFRIRDPSGAAHFQKTMLEMIKQTNADPLSQVYLWAVNSEDKMEWRVREQYDGDKG